jgi:hypothetical protein
MNQNRDFYRIQDVRPPFTYAALIRQVQYSQIYKTIPIFTLYRPSMRQMEDSLPSTKFTTGSKLTSPSSGGTLPRGK